MKDELTFSDDDLTVIVQDWSEHDPDQRVAINLARECIRLRAVLTRAEAAPVDDAMLDRALDALRQGQYEGDQFRDSMRRALTAAMQQTEKK